MKRKKNYRPIREKLWQIILRAFCVSAALILVFSFGTREYLYKTCDRQAKEQIEENTSRMLRYISQIQSETAPEWQMQEIRAKLLLYSTYGIIIDDPITEEWRSFSSVQIYPGDTVSCHAVNALIAEDGTIAADNRRAVSILLMFQKDKKTDQDRGFYFCDADVLNLPEVDQFYKDCKELTDKELPFDGKTVENVGYDLVSAYVNRETRTFIPHEGTLKLERITYDDSYLVESSQEEILETRDIRIDLDLPGYELMEMQPIGSNDAYPKKMLFLYWGEDQAEFDQYQDLIYPDMTNPNISHEMQHFKDGTRVYEKNTPVYVDGKPYILAMRFRFDPDDPQILALWKWWITLFSAAVFVIAALWVWRRSVLNRAKYAFEDMQRDLTDHLAHDIKTPLTAIGGYTENILDGRLTAEEQDQYLHAILDNIAFTDSLISRTLQLNKTDGKPARREKVAVKPMLEESIRKYAPLLDEKHITCIIGGEAEWLCDRSGLETILENLISNAVKYTPDGGKIEAKLSRNQLRISNSVRERIEVKKLKEPFVRGDAARSNTEGCGLGLSLADHAAAANGWQLRLSCTEETFTAVVG